MVSFGWFSVEREIARNEARMKLIYIRIRDRERKERKIKEKNLFVRNEEAGVWSCHGG